MILASTWLGTALLISAFAWLADRRLGLLALPMAAFLAAGAIWVPTGTPRFTPPPPAEYAVLGHKIVVDTAIYLLLDDGTGEPRYYVLPYSTGAANDLQDAENAGEGKGIRVKIDGEGGEEYDGPPPVTAEETKTPEAPSFEF